MASYTISSCTIDDGPALAYNNFSAFWTDSNWVLLWPGRTLEYVITQGARRMPYNLLQDPARRRHLKAVDATSGAIVGYARWILPDAGPEIEMAGDLNNLWSAARVPAVSQETEREVKRKFDAADWNFDRATAPLDPPMIEMKERLFKKKNYLLLDYLAVHPDNKGQGIATMLVESGIEEAKKMGLDAFVLAFKAGLGVYKRAGFRLLEQIVQDDSKFGGSGEWGVYFLEKVVEK